MSVVITGPGAIGPPGPKGDTGSTGAQGIPGAQGEAGIQGPQGTTGAAGPTGTQGAKGDQGTQGAQGVQGVKGDTGTQGPQGTTGSSGPAGAAGAQGIQGIKGDTGSQGVAGPTGATGATGTTRALTAPSTQIQMPGSATQTASNTMGTGVASFLPLDVGPDPVTFKALAVNVTTAVVGGVGTLTKAAVYADNGTGGGPLVTSGGKLQEVSITASTTGLKLLAPSGGNFTLQPGRYWVSGFYFAGTTAPTTPPAFTCISSGGFMWATTTTFTAPRYLVVLGLTDFPVTSQTPQASSSTSGRVCCTIR